MRSIPHPRRLALLLLLPVLAILGTACDPSNPAHVRAWYDLNPEVGAEVTVETMNDAQRAVVAELAERERRWYAGVLAAQQQRADSGNCYTEMRKVFPAHAWDRMSRIIDRESGGNPRAQNPSSSAAGCAQLLRLHSPRFDKLGYTWERDRYSAQANIRVAHDLWLAAGWSPWRLTDY
jgi:hypothetical protein